MWKQFICLLRTSSFFSWFAGFLCWFYCSSRKLSLFHSYCTFGKCSELFVHLSNLFFQKQLKHFLEGVALNSLPVYVFVLSTGGPPRPRHSHPSLLGALWEHPHDHLAGHRLCLQGTANGERRENATFHHALTVWTHMNAHSHSNMNVLYKCMSWCDAIMNEASYSYSCPHIHSYMKLPAPAAYWTDKYDSGMDLLI